MRSWRAKDVLHLYNDYRCSHSRHCTNDRSDSDSRTLGIRQPMTSHKQDCFYLPFCVCACECVFIASPSPSSAPPRERHAKALHCMLARVFCYRRSSTWPLRDRRHRCRGRRRNTSGGGRLGILVSWAYMSEKRAWDAYHRQEWLVGLLVQGNPFP